MPVWSKAATAQLKQKILEGTVPTNPAELTNDYLYGTLSAIIFPDYHLTGPSGKASVIQRFWTAFDNIQLENEVAGARRVEVGGGKTIFSFARIFSSLLESSEKSIHESLHESLLFILHMYFHRCLRRRRRRRGIRLRRRGGLRGGRRRDGSCTCCRPGCC